MSVITIKAQSHTKGIPPQHKIRIKKYIGLTYQNGILNILTGIKIIWISVKVYFPSKIGRENKRNYKKEVYKLLGKHHSN